MTYPGHLDWKNRLSLEGEITAAIDKFCTTRSMTLTDAQRSELETTLYNTLVFNRKLRYAHSGGGALLAKKATDLLKIFALRHRVYARLGYDREFPPIIEGLNFDGFDGHSAVLFTRGSGTVTGTCRVIFDSDDKLPIDKNYSLDPLRREYGKLAELSRLVIDKPTKGLGKEFKHLTAGVYRIMLDNDADALVSVMSPEHYPLYRRFGGFEIKDSLPVYGTLQQPFVITAWDVSRISPFFRKIFLDHPAHQTAA